jgi:hypothetical protein
MLAGMTTLTADVDELSRQAHDIAVRNPPSRVLETAILGVLFMIGWLPGRVWFHAQKTIVFMFLAVRLGWRRGMKAQVAATPAGPSPMQPGPANTMTWVEKG